jgi:hypothetical protein
MLEILIFCTCGVTQTLSVSNKKSWQIFFDVGLGTIMVPINASIVNVSLPIITEFFGATVATSEWVLTSYLILLYSFLVSLVIFGVMNACIWLVLLGLFFHPFYVVWHLQYYY